MMDPNLSRNPDKTVYQLIECSLTSSSLKIDTQTTGTGNLLLTGSNATGRMTCSIPESKTTVSKRAGRRNTCINQQIIEVQLM